MPAVVSKLFVNLYVLVSLVHSTGAGLYPLFISFKNNTTLIKKYKTHSFTNIFIWIRKLDSNSLTKTKNWSGRNEFTETSGKLHPLWPQNKWLHTPRTTDYRHTRQDRWIQTELAFILAKNATKPNPFEIIPLQTTRKENNLKTEEALARAAVTPETERIKGSIQSLMYMMIKNTTIIII